MDFSITFATGHLIGLVALLIFLPLLAAMIGYAKGERDANWGNQLRLNGFKDVCMRLSKAEERAAYFEKAVELVGEAHKRDLEREIRKAKREHGKKVRKQQDRKLEASEREYEARMQELLTASNLWKWDAQRQAENLALARMEFSGFQSLLTDVLENQVKLTGVRNKILSEINNRHKMLKEDLK